MSRLWIVECQFKDNDWDICDFAKHQYAFTNYFEAHKGKKEIQKYLNNCSSHWEKKDFRVREYVRRGEK